MNRKFRVRAIAAGILLGVAAIAGTGCARTPEAKSARYMEKGSLLLKNKDAPRAILAFRNAAQLTPKNAEVHYQLARAYMAAQDYNQVALSLKRALALNPNHREAELLLAELMAATNEPETLKMARERLNELAKGQPGDGRALQALAVAELKLGAVDDAMKHFTDAQAASPHEVAYAVTMAQAQIEQRDVAGAEKTLKGAVAASPRSPEAAAALGRFYLYQQQYEPAERELQRALTLDGGHVWARYLLALLQRKTGREQQAAENLKTLSHSSEASLRPVYGLYLFETGQKAEGVKEFERLAKEDSSDRQARTRLIAAYAETNREADAKKILESALKKNPKDLDALLQRAEFAINAGRYADAETDLNQVAHLKPDAAEAHFAMARLHKARGAALLERDELNETVRLNPAFLPGRLALARSVMQTDPHAALNVLNEAPAGQRDLVPLLEEKNWVMLRAADWAGARAGVDHGLTVQKTPTMLLQDGILKMVAKRYVDARVSIRAALAQAPDDLRALQFLIHAYADAGQTAEGVAVVREHAAAHRNSAPVQYFLGAVLAQTGDKAHASEAFNAAKALDPHYIPADLAAAQMQLKDKNWDDARRHLNAVLAEKADVSGAHLWLGMLEESVGNHDAAIAEFRKVLEAEPKNVVALNNLASLLTDNGTDPHQAIEFAQRAKEVAPNNAAVDDTLGWAYHRAGLSQQAIQYLQSATVKDSTAVRQYHLGAAYLNIGKPDKARVALEAALRLEPNGGHADKVRELLRGLPAGGTKSR